MSALVNPYYGRINRGDWWLLQLLIVVFIVVGFYITVTFASDPNLPMSKRTPNESLMVVTVILSAAYMNFASCVNRLRDSDSNGFFYLSFLLPTVGTGLMLYFCGIKAGRNY
jgi:uncharacterized membrane protein YhaH (DUF805 family)